jgi:hypothetical protein
MHGKRIEKSSRHECVRATAAAADDFHTYSATRQLDLDRFRAANTFQKLCFGNPDIRVPERCTRASTFSVEFVRETVANTSPFRRTNVRIRRARNGCTWSEQKPIVRHRPGTDKIGYRTRNVTWRLFFELSRATGVAVSEIVSEKTSTVAIRFTASVGLFRKIPVVVTFLPRLRSFSLWSCYFHRCTTRRVVIFQLNAPQRESDCRQFP